MKHHFIYAIGLLFLFSCGQNSGSTSDSNSPKVDTARPKEELTLIKKMVDADSVANTQINDLNKRAVIDSGAKAIASYLTKTLNAKVDNWVAYINELDGSDGLATIQFTITKDWEKVNSDGLQIHVTLTAGVNNNKNPDVFKVVKTLKKGDLVVISGEFEKSGGEVNNDPISSGLNPEFALTGPEYDFNLTSIKKRN